MAEKAKGTGARGARGGAKLTVVKDGEGRDGKGGGLAAGDNSGDKTQVEEIVVLSVLAKLKPLIAKQKAINEEINEVYGSAKKVVTRKLLTELMKDAAEKGQRRDQQDAEEQRVRLRRLMGLPVAGDGQKDFLTEDTRTEHDWRMNGYSVGVQGGEAKPQDHEVPPRFHQAWLEGHGDGVKRYMAAQAANAPKQLPKATAAPKPKEEPATIADQKLAEKREEKAVLEGLNSLPAAPADDFEASPEELASQTTRQVVQAQRDEAGTEAV